MVDFSTSNGYAWQVVQYNLKYDITKGSLIDSRIQDGLGDDETSLDGITKAVNKDITEGVDGKSDSSITVGKRNADEIEWLKLCLKKGEGSRSLEEKLRHCKVSLGAN